MVEGDGAEVARDRSQEEARDLGARERERLEDATPDRESGDRFRVSSQDEAAEESGHRYGQKEHRTPPHAGRELTLGARREDLDDMRGRRHEDAEARVRVDRAQEEPHARPPWIFSRLSHAAAGV